MRRFYLELARSPSPTPMALLAQRALEPALAALSSMRPTDRVRVAAKVELGEHTEVSALLRARAALDRFDIALDLWPQLPSSSQQPSGRFLNTSTAATFQARLLPLLDALEGSGIGLALDLEPSEGLAHAAWTVRDERAPLWQRARSAGAALAGVAKSVVDARQGRRDLSELARDLVARNIAVHAAVLPPLLATPSLSSDRLRAWALGCPSVDDAGAPLFGLQAAMCYPSMVRARDARDRQREKQTLALWAARHRASFDAVVVGLTSHGILGDEPVYEDAALLAEDVRAMDALAFGDVAVYSLEGLWFGAHGRPDAALTLRHDVDIWLAAAFGDSDT
ncbi:MAG TPA: hypothetical protein VGO62_02400 [Myxococcota bacterium]